MKSQTEKECLNFGFKNINILFHPQVFRTDVPQMRAIKVTVGFCPDFEYHYKATT